MEGGSVGLHYTGKWPPRAVKCRVRLQQKVTLSVSSALFDTDFARRDFPIVLPFQEWLCGRGEKDRRDFTGAHDLTSYNVMPAWIRYDLLKYITSMVDIIICIR